ncbi:hypothetical protein QYF36_009454 [Acer negundo]|nr:hypothetical protein QYF36_009454 [Acer negundo]
MGPSSIFPPSASLKYSMVVLAILFAAVLVFPELALAKNAGITRHYKFDIKMQNVTRLCRTKSIVTVNGQFPGPRIIAREGDRLLIKLKGTQLGSLLAVGSPFAFLLIIQVFGSCIAIWKFTPVGD